MAEREKLNRPDNLAEVYRVQHGDLQKLVEEGLDMEPDKFWCLVGRQLGIIHDSNPYLAFKYTGMIAEYRARVLSKKSDNP